MPKTPAGKKEKEKIRKMLSILVSLDKKVGVETALLMSTTDIINYVYDELKKWEKRRRDAKN